MTVTAPARPVPRPGTGRPPTARSRRPRGLRPWLADRPAWPVVALLAGYPVLWVLGLADASVILMAIPMVLRMRVWHRTGRKIMVPPAFGLWLLFLVCAAAGVLTLGLSAPDTLVSSVSNRLLSYANRTVTYGGLTVILLYVGNLTEKELPRRRLAWLLGLVGIYTLLGGLGGIADPTFKFASPLTFVLPHAIQANTLISISLHPAFSQVTDVLGGAHGRPKAPFEYTNTWGNCLTILLPWLLVAWYSYGSRRQRKYAIAIAAIAIVPLVYSLNRTAWAGVALTVAYLAARLAARGKLAVLGLLCAGIALAGVMVVATPLQGIITARFQHQQSNTVRASLSLAAIDDANAAPFIGFGDTRHQQGSVHSIAIGQTSSCANCGEYAIGSNGQLFLLQICSGWLGAGLYFAFFGFQIWRYRRDKSPYGMAGLITIGLSFLYMFTYVAVTAPLEFTMVMVALLWKNDRWMRGQDRTMALAGTPGQASTDTLRRPVTGLPRRPATGRSRPDHRRNDGAGWAGMMPPADVLPSAVRPPAAGAAGRSRADGRLADVAKGGLLNLIGAAVAGVSTLVVTLLVTRSFSQAAAGAFFTATSLFLIIEAAASLGSPPGMVYFIARLRSTGQLSRIPEVLHAAVRPVLIASVAAAVVMALVAEPVARLLLHGQLGHVGARPTEVATALRALAVTLPFAALLDTLLGATRGFRAMAPTNVTERIGRSLLQLAGIAVVAVIGDAAWLAPLWALPYVPAAGLAWLWLRRIQRRARPVTAAPGTAAPVTADSAAGPERGREAAGPEQGREAPGDRREPLRFWRFTGPRGLAALAQITIQRVDIVLVAIIRGPVEAAIYTAATRFLVAGQLGNQAISQAAQPRFTEMFAQGDLRGANRIYQVTTAWLILVTWPLYLLVVSFGPQILTVFGRSYEAGNTVMVILGLTMLLATGCGQVDMVLVTTGRSSWSLLNGLLAVVVNVGLDVLLIPRYGITGAAIGWSVAIVVTNLMPLAQLAATVRLNPLGRGTVITAVLTVLSFGVLPWTVRAALGPGAVPSLAAVGGGCALMAAGMWRFRDDLYLAAMPGGAQLAAALRRRRGASQP